LRDIEQGVFRYTLPSGMDKLLEIFTIRDDGKYEKIGPILDLDIREIESTTGSTTGIIVTF
jgi:hypothetical protein